MRASNAVGLALISSMSIFGIYGRHKTNTALPPGPEPVYVNGQMGIYNPDTHAFVPSTSPLFDETCDLIQQRREQANGNNSSGTFSGVNYYSESGESYHHWYFLPESHSYTYSSGGVSGMRSSSFSSSSSHSSGSARGGIGSTGHSIGSSSS